jgi:Ca2+-binding RTX toxin-like protein
MKRTLGIATAISTLAITAGIALADVVNCLPGPSCTGTAGPDQIQGTDEEDRINGLGGSDDITPQGADDLANGGPGEDYLSELFSDGEDTLLGGGGDDYLEGGVQADVLRGGPGDERAAQVFRGTTVPDWRLISMYGDEGGDKLFGGGGRDSMQGEQGRDVMKGGAGGDYLDAADQDTGARDVVDCGKGFDRYSAHAEDRVDDSCERKVPATIEA